MNNASFIKLLFVYSFFCLTAVAQPPAYPNLDGTYTTSQVSEFIERYSNPEVDTLGLIYTYGATLRNINMSTSQTTEAIYFFVELKNLYHYISQKEIFKIRLALLKHYVGTDDKLTKIYLEEVDSIISIARKNKWDIVCVEAYLLRNVLIAKKVNYTIPYPDDFFDVYQEFEQSLESAPLFHFYMCISVGGYFQQRKAFDQAILYYKKARELTTISQKRSEIDLSTLFLAQAQRLNGEFYAAEQNAHQVINNRLNQDGLTDIDLTRWAAEELAHIYKHQGDYSKSTFYWELYDAKVKAYQKQSSSSAILQPTLIQKVENDLAERKAKAELQQRLIAEANSKNNLLRIVMLVSFIFSVTLLLLIINWYKQRNKRLLRESEIAIATSREEERESIALELHDNVGNMLVAVKNAIPQNIKNYEKISTAIQGIYDTIRQSSHSLSTAGLTSVGLAESCKDYIQLIDKEQIIKMSVVGNEKKIPLNLSKEAFRITQELIQNTLKYSNASEINFALLINPSSLILNFEDDGIGFENSSTNNGIGLKNIRERVKRLAGEITIDTSHTYGSSFWISLPIKS